MESQNKWWNNPSCSLENFNVCSLFNGSFSKDESEACDQCKARFNLLKRKRLCETCGLIYCKSCLINLGQIKVCKKCKIFNLWPVDKQLVASLRVRDLMYYLQTNRIPTNTCKEKNDLVELVVVHLNYKQYRQQPPRNNPSNSTIPRRTQSNSPNVNTGRSASQTPIRSNNDEGIRVFSTDDNDPLIGWHILDNPIEDGIVLESVSHPEQATNSAQLFDNTEVQNIVESCDTAESTDKEIVDAASEVVTETAIGNERVVDDDPAHTEVESIEESSISDIPLAEHSQNIYPAVDVLEEIISDTASNIEPTTNTSTNSTPQHQQGAAIEISSIIKLSSLMDEDAVKTLTVRQCKEILSLHRVDFSGVMEKHELNSKLILLWKDFKERYADVSSIPEDQLCKICMDAPIDCVFLNCGHVISCIFCGKQMAECPICRQNVIRVVRIFKT